MVHCRPLTDACSACWIDGKATLTIVTSRPAMNTARQHVASTTERRRASRSGRHRGLTVAINNYYITTTKVGQADPEVQACMRASQSHAQRPGNRRSSRRLVLANQV